MTVNKADTRIVIILWAFFFAGWLLGGAVVWMMLR